jgi:hypothetical protein
VRRRERRRRRLRQPGHPVKAEQPSGAAALGGVDLVVLSDYLVAHPRMVRDLHSRGVPHLPVRVRDGTGLVGPLVIPSFASYSLFQLVK